MSKRDYYEVLEVARSASLDDIKKSYRKKAIQYHPDKNPGNKEAEERFKEATEAYSVLSEPEARARYDQFGHAAFEQGGGFSGFDFGDFSGFEDIFGDIFSAFFGGAPGGKRTRGRAGRDLRYDLEIEFEEAAFGTQKEITLQRQVTCERCQGSGAASANALKSCPQCKGSGQMRMQQGFFTISRTCSSCGGSGQIIKDPCTECNGAGSRSRQSRINVKVPAGIDHGQRLKLRGEGEPGSKGGPSGDLYVQIFVKEHEFFKREDAELFCEVPITYAAATLGTEIEVPTLEGKEKLRIPAGTPSGTVFRLRNRGLQVLGSSSRGDQHVKVFIHVPKKLNDDHRKVIEQLQEIEGVQPKEEQKGFFEKVKNMFA
ncbi:MAG: molecular chaperone DnaJ [Bdellovibrionota bacterium]|nr:MAG: molecular chaperone DnaJ [Bdellovibrionota bacterium]